MYIFSSKMAGYAIRLVLPYFLVRLLTVAEFGAYRQFFLLEMYIGTLFQLGLNQALYYFIPRDIRNSGAYFLNTVLLNSLVFTVAFAVIGLAVSPLAKALNMEILKDAFWILAANVVILMLVVACDCYLTARERVRAAAAFEIVGQLLLSVASVVAAVMTHDLNTILAWLVVARAIQLVAMFVFIHWRMDGFRAERYFFGIREQVRYGIVLGAGGTLLTMLMKLNEFFVNRYYGAEGFAIYSAGCTDLPFVRMFTQSVAVVTLGQFAILEKNNDWEGMRRLWRQVLTSSYATAVPFIIVLVVFAKPIIIFMFTDKYAEAITIFQIATVQKLALVFNATLILRAINRNDLSIWTNVISLVVAPFMFYGGMKAGGMIGIIIAQSVLLVGSRWAGVYVMNRAIPSPMPYFAAWGEIWQFYRTSFRKGRGWMQSAAHRSGLGR